VHGIVQRSGGRIEVESKPNEGTQFRIYLPETQAAANISAVSASPPPPEPGHETILLAEDEIRIRAMTRTYLESLGYRVLEATDGLEAVKISRKYESSIDLILTDYLMPIMRGDAVVDSIRKHRPDIKALYITGSSGVLAAGGPVEVLLKPFKFPELGRRVRTVLDSDLKLQKSA
jgi:CheY-like chemotaxis protein